MEVGGNTPDEPLGVVAMATTAAVPLQKPDARDAWWRVGKAKLEIWATYLGVRLQNGEGAVGPCWRMVEKVLGTTGEETACSRNRMPPQLRTQQPREKKKAAVDDSR